MTFQIIRGDLFDAPLSSAIGHGCNTKGFMGAGIAKQFRDRFPQMYEYYRGECANGNAALGEVFMWFEPTGQIICNMFTQPDPGPCADRSAIVTAVTNSFNILAEMGCYELSIPMIGCGIGGLDWADVSDDLNNLSEHHPKRNLTVYIPKGI